MGLGEAGYMDLMGTVGRWMPVLPREWCPSDNANSAGHCENPHSITEHSGRGGRVLWSRTRGGSGTLQGGSRDKSLCQGPTCAAQ